MTDEPSKLDEQQNTRVKLTEVSEDRDVDCSYHEKARCDDALVDEPVGNEGLAINSGGPVSSPKVRSLPGTAKHGSDFIQADSGKLSRKLDIDLGDNYDVLEWIGQGATGQVYKVRDKSLDRVLAVKVLRKDLVVDNQTVKRFNHEAAAAAGLTHANVVSVYGHGEAKDGSPYITMNYIDGESLSAILKKEPKLEWQRAVNLFTQICDGLEHAHENGLIHRDLKPSNIIISKSESGIEVAHIVDFGIAKVVANRADTLNTLTASGDFLGTPMYMSPEQCLGQNVDPRTDFYALGCMLFEAVSGKSPFAGASTVEMIAKKMSEQSPILKTETLPPAMSMIVSCCMARHAQDRYDSAQALKLDLESLAEKQGPKHARLKFGMDKALAGKRLLAFFIDNVIISSGSGIVSFFLTIPLIVMISLTTSGKDNSELSMNLMMAFIYVVIPTIVIILYYTFFESRRGTTPGKQLVGLNVCDLYGNKLSGKQAFLRNLAKMTILSVLPSIGALGFLLPIPALGIGTLLLATSLAIGICVRSWKLHHQAPWDVWVGTQIRRR